MEDTKRFEVVTNVQNGALPPKHMAQTREAQQDGDFNANGSEVIQQLKALGYDPIEKLVGACLGEELTLWQKTVIDRELLQYCAPKLRAVEHSGRGGAAIPIVISSYEDENI